MKHIRRHFLFSAILAVLVTVGMGLSAVQSGTMDIMMAASPDMADMDSEACGSCAGGGDGIAAGCSTICMVTAFATLPVSMDLEKTFQADRYEVFPATPRDGPSLIEPIPPKPHNFS